MVLEIYKKSKRKKWVVTLTKQRSNRDEHCESYIRTRDEDEYK